MKKGFTLVELQIAIIVSAILILALGGIAHISNTSHAKIRKEAQVYIDLSYGLKLLRNKVRKSNSVLYVDYSPSDPGWLKNRGVLVVDQGGFGFYQGDEQSDVQFIYASDMTNLTNRKTIFSIGSGADENKMRFEEINGVVKIKDIKGKREGIEFEIPDVSIKRRAS